MRNPFFVPATNYYLPNLKILLSLILIFYSINKTIAGEWVHSPFAGPGGEEDTTIHGSGETYLIEPSSDGHTPVKSPTNTTKVTPNTSGYSKIQFIKTDHSGNEIKPQTPPEKSEVIVRGDNLEYVIDTIKKDNTYYYLINWKATKPGLSRIEFKITENGRDQVYQTEYIQCEESLFQSTVNWMEGHKELVGITTSCFLFLFRREKKKKKGTE